MESIYEVNFSSVDGKTIDHLVNWGELLEKVFDAGVEIRLILEPDDYQLLHKLRMEKKKRDLEKSYKQYHNSPKKGCYLIRLFSHPKPINNCSPRYI